MPESSFILNKPGRPEKDYTLVIGGESPYPAVGAAADSFRAFAASFFLFSLRCRRRSISRVLSIFLCFAKKSPPAILIKSL
jgi:hypothetical protein